jgi:cholesterol transport system auxiliary component
MRKSIILSLCIVFITGCASFNKPYPEITNYSLEVTRDLDATKEEEAMSLKVKLFSVSPRFDTKILVYKTDNFVYETDYYNRFMSFPSYMFTEQIAGWLAASPKIKYVADTRLGSPADYVLNGKILEMYGDFRNKEQAKAALKIEMVFLDERGDNPEVVVQKIYSQEIALDEPTVSALIDGFNQGLENILLDFESDLENQAKSKTQNN